MSCGEIRKLFSRRLDGRLGAAEQEALEGHLSRCAACREDLARWTAAARLLRAGGPTPVPGGLAERAFRAALAAERGPSLASWFVAAGRRAAVAGAIAALAIWVGVLAARRSPRAEATAQDPIEVAVQLWGEGGADGE